MRDCGTPTGRQRGGSVRGLCDKRLHRWLAVCCLFAYDMETGCIRACASAGECKPDLKVYYNVLSGHPFMSWGENVIVGIQNAIAGALWALHAQLTHVLMQRTPRSSLCTGTIRRNSPKRRNLCWPANMESFQRDTCETSQSS